MALVQHRPEGRLRGNVAVTSSAPLYNLAAGGNSLLDITRVIRPSGGNNLAQRLQT